MRSFLLLTDALDFVELRLQDPLTPEEVALHCHCSLSALQKLFRYALQMGIREYIDCRRLIRAAMDLRRSRARITDIAFQYQYQSLEVFGRAFSRLWGRTPSAYRREAQPPGLPPPAPTTVMKGKIHMSRRLDISSLYESLLEKAGTYVLCFDVDGLQPINDLSYDAGDLIIAESLRRLEAVAGDDMLLFRVGGDEFALVTGLTSQEDVRRLAETVLCQNGAPIPWRGREVPVAVSAAGVRLPDKGPLLYGELFGSLRAHLPQAKQKKDRLFLQP